MAKIPTPSGPEEIVYQGKIIEIVHQQMKIGDKEKVFEFARRSPGTRLIIISPDDKILLTREYRTELEDWDYRLPGGKVFDSLKEYNQFLKTSENILSEAIKGAKREANQEVGINPKDLKHFATSVCGATVVWDLYYFVVTEYDELNKQELEVGENIETNWFTFKEAKEVCLSGKMSEDRSAIVLLRYLHSQGKL